MKDNVCVTRVLHERLLSEHIDETLVGQSETIAKLVRAGVLGRIPLIMDYKQNTPDGFLEDIWTRLEPLGEEISSWPGAAFTLSASVARAHWADARNVDHLPWPLFGAIPGETVRRRHVVGQGYAHVNQLLRNRVIEVRGAGAPIPMYVPPIPALILDRCGNRADQFFSEALALREEFAAARKKLWAYQRLISNEDDRTLGELCQAYRDAVLDVAAALNRLAARRTDSSLLLELWETVCELTTSSQENRTTIEPGLNLRALLTTGFRWVEIRRVRARARLLFDVYEKALQIRNYGSLIGRVFKTDAAELAKAAHVFENIGANIDSIVAVDRTRPWEGVNKQEP